MQRDFNEFAVDIKISGLSEFEQVLCKIYQEGILRMNLFDEWKINLRMLQLKHSSYMNVP